MDGKVALVSGGARGQGAAEARLLVERGARVVIGDVLEAEGEALAAELGDDVTFVPLDVTSSEQWATAVDVAVETYGSLTTLVNNAGIVRTGLIEALAEDDWSAVIGVNQTGCLELGPAGIRVNAVCPGTIDTPMVSAPEFDAVDKDAVFGSLPVPRIGQAAEVAEVVAFLASDAASYCTGAEHLVDGGSLAGDPLEIG